MFRLSLLAVVVGAAFATLKSGDELVSTVMTNCADMDCVKSDVLSYLDTVLNKQSDARNIKNIDMAIFKRAARVLKTHEFRLRLPETIFDSSEIVYNPKSGLDIATNGDNEGRGLLKKKLLFPALLLLKLKMKALMPIFVALIGIKAMKALILSKLAIAIVLGFVIYQLVSKSGMPMGMSMTPIAPPPPPPDSAYGVPSTSPPSSYEPGWEPSASGPYSRVWTGGASDSAQNLAYSAYYPGSASSTTVRP